jgi:hypothetical protein
MSNTSVVDIKDKFCLSVEEASLYFNIGQKKLRNIAADHIDSGLVIQNGSKLLIKRIAFENFLKKTTSI